MFLKDLNQRGLLAGFSLLSFSILLLGSPVKALEMSAPPSKKPANQLIEVHDKDGSSAKVNANGEVEAHDMDGSSAFINKNGQILAKDKDGSQVTISSDHQKIDIVDADGEHIVVSLADGIKVISKDKKK